MRKTENSSLGPDAWCGECGRLKTGLEKVKLVVCWDFQKMVWRVDSGQRRARKSGEVECGGCGCTERREDGGRPRAGVEGGQGSVLRRKKEQEAPRLPAPGSCGSTQPTAQCGPPAFMGVLNPETEQ